MNEFIKSTAVRINAAFTNEVGVAADPTTITFRVKPPGAAVLETYLYLTDPEVVKDSVGAYHMILVVATEGVWKYLVQGTGAVQIAARSQFSCWGDDDLI